MLLLLSVFALTFDGLLSQTLLPFEYIYMCVLSLSLSHYGSGMEMIIGFLRGATGTAGRLVTWRHRSGY